jgi:hypothetical protein
VIYLGTALSVINRITGEINFRSGLHIRPHCPAQSLFAQGENASRNKSLNLPLRGWKRHILGFHGSEHGIFEVEALSAEEERVYVVLLSHRHSFYEQATPGDAERRAFHEGVVSSDLAGQKEFTWGEVHYHLESNLNQDWIVIAYSPGAKVTLPEKEVILRLCVHEDLPEDNT